MLDHFWRRRRNPTAVAVLLIPLLALSGLPLPGTSVPGAAAVELPPAPAPAPLPASEQWARCSYPGGPVQGSITNAGRLQDGRFALAATFEDLQLWCVDPGGGGRSITVEDTTYGLILNPTELRGVAGVRMGDWSLSGHLDIILREDEILALQVTGGGEQVRLISVFEFSRRTGHELVLEELQIAVGPGIFR